MFKIITASLLFLAMFGIGFLIAGLWRVSADGESRVFEIQSGWGVREITRNLYQNGLIRSPLVFKVYGTITGSAHRLKPGSYSLNPAMDGSEILNILVAGPAEDIIVTVKEGDTLLMVDKKLGDLKILPPGTLIHYRGKSLEGFLFPDTYRFFSNSSSSAVIKKFLDNFYKKTKPVLGAVTDDFYKLLIIASMIEKEVPFSDDRRLVAGIIYRRLAIDIPLQIDATSLYAKEINNERYDTYQYYGLPPTPISNPGLDAILAAANPTESDFLYYLSDPVTKKTIFSKTFEEHDANRTKYLKR